MTIQLLILWNFLCNDFNRISWYSNFLSEFAEIITNSVIFVIFRHKNLIHISDRSLDFQINESWNKSSFSAGKKLNFTYRRWKSIHEMISRRDHYFSWGFSKKGGRGGIRVLLFLAAKWRAQSSMMKLRTIVLELRWRVFCLYRILEFIYFQIRNLWTN